MTRKHSTVEPQAERFDAAYYREWYSNRPVQTKARIAAVCDATLAMAKWWGIPIRSVLDVGAGHGWWGQRLAAQHPRIRYQGVDVSAHASSKHGFICEDIATWKPAKRYDLVVCQGTLHYLDDKACKAALRNLVQSTLGLLFLEIPTQDDLDEEVIDVGASHLDAHWRSAAWYRRQLREQTVELGCGLHVPINSPYRFYALERR